MGHEIEAKFRLDAPEALRQRLRAAGAERVSSVHEVNTLLDGDDQRLFAGDCGLRLRVATPDDASPAVATLTFKGPRFDADSDVKRREEVESAVGDAAAVQTILTCLGFRPKIVFEKRRETWRLGDAEVTLDELPKLGWFCEIEADSAAAVARTRDQLELDAADVVMDTYVHMAAQHGEVVANGVRELRFA